MTTEPYRPSNATEGDMFMARWCERCARDASFGKNPRRGCQIIAATMAFDIGDAEYPTEWIRNADDTEWPGSARCTAFVPRGEYARRAWITRRKHQRESCADLFDGAT